MERSTALGPCKVPVLREIGSGLKPLVNPLQHPNKSHVAASLHSPVPWMVPAWEMNMSRMHINQPISLPMLFQNQPFPDNFSLLYRLIPRARGNSVFALNVVIQYCDELNTYSQRENEA